MTTQAVVWRAVNAPLAQDVTGCGRSELHPKHTAFEPVVHLGDFRSGLVRMGHQFHLDNARPLNVLVAPLVRADLRPLQQRRCLDASDDEVVELARLAVKGTDMPAQAIVNQRKRDNLSLGLAAGDGVVLDAQRAFLMNCPGHGRQHVQIGMRQP